MIQHPGTSNIGKPSYPWVWKRELNLSFEKKTWLEAETVQEGEMCGNTKIDFFFLLPFDLTSMGWAQLENTGQGIRGSLVSQSKEQNR